jgi:hypothetical protein
MTAPAKRVTISFTVPSALHLIIGLLLAAGTITAWGMHFALPANDAFRNTAAYVGNFAGFMTVGYCIWCATRRANSDTAGLTEVTEAAIEAAAVRQKGIQSTLEAATTAILLALREIAEQVAEDSGARKRLEDAVDAATEAIQEAAGNVIALQDCYLHAGQLLVIPEQLEVPHDSALAA